MSETAADPHRLHRFVTAQDRGGIYQRAVAELRAGEKVSHWMWFVFPQIAGLGTSATSREFALSTVEEARAYLAHPVLGRRLRECARILADTQGRSAERIFGPVDALKLRSSMTLFAAAGQSPGENVFRTVLAKYFNGVADAATLARLLPAGLQPRTADSRGQLGATVPDASAHAVLAGIARAPQAGGRCDLSLVKRI